MQYVGIRRQAMLAQPPLEWARNHAATRHCQCKLHKNTFMENLLPATTKPIGAFMRSTGTFVRFQRTLGSRNTFMKSPISNFTDMRSVGAAVIQADQRDIKKQTGDFRDYANAPINRPKTRGQDYANYLRVGHHSTVTNSKTEC